MHMVYQTSLTTFLMNLANLHAYGLSLTTLMNLANFAYGLSNVFDYISYELSKLACIWFVKRL